MQHQQLAGSRCPVCLSTSTAPALRKDGVLLLRCADCHLRFCAEEPEAAPLEALYDETYFTGGGAGGAGYDHYLADERTHRRQARRYLHRLEHLGLRPGRLLDVGCAAGFFLDEARRAGWDAHGIDVSPWAAAHAREHFGLDVRCESLLAASPAAPFDVVTVFNVFEHLPTPHAAADRLARLVRPGGHLLIETWDADSVFARLCGRRWHQYSPHYVPYYYTRASLARLFRPGLWHTVEYGPWTKWISVQRACAVVAHDVPTAPLRRLVGAVGHSPLGALELPYSLGDLVLLTLRRRTDRPSRRSLAPGVPAYGTRERRPLTAATPARP
ncbi:MAG TPA: class I SAM-dependent methyltransferase [Gemmatimonadales bacterium]|nr:class I SAM-dependent methyltransferase [Gemmatimonadales bacterium]